MKATKVTGMLMFGASFTLGAAAFASGTDLGQNGGRTQITLSDLRDKCESIMKNPQMVKPAVDVVCDQTRFVWKQCDTSFSLKDQTQIRASIGMKDWMAYAPSSQDQANQHACSTFVKHQLTVKPVSEPMKCEDLLKTFKTDDDLSNYCATLIQNRVGQDSALQQDTATSDTFNTCTGQFIQLGKDDKCLGNQSQGQQGQQGGQSQGQGNQSQGQGSQSQGQGSQSQGQGSQSQGQGSQSQGQGQQSGSQSQGQGRVSHDTSADASGY